jgi:hypothetical protein
VSTLVAACGRRPATCPRRPTAADTSMAIDTSPATCAGHHPSGRRSFRKQRTVNPPIASARYNFLYSSFKAGPDGEPGNVSKPSTDAQTTGVDRCPTSGQ